MVIFADSGQFDAGAVEPALHGFVRLATAAAEALFQNFERRSAYEDRHRVGTIRFHLGPTVDVDFELLAVTKNRGETGIEKRTQIATKREGNEFIVTIPDPESD